MSHILVVNKRCMLSAIMMSVVLMSIVDSLKDTNDTQYKGAQQIYKN